MLTDHSFLEHNLVLDYAFTSYACTDKSAMCRAYTPVRWQMLANEKTAHTNFLREPSDRLNVEVATSTISEGPRGKRSSASSSRRSEIPGTGWRPSRSSPGSGKRTSPSACPIQD